MNKRLIIFALAAILLLGIGLMYMNPSGEEALRDEAVKISEKTYSDTELGIEFRYPGKYFLTEKNMNESQRPHRQLMLVENTPDKREEIKGQATKPQKAPVAITVDFYRNNLDKQNPYEWASGSTSNYQLGDGSYATTTLGESFAIRYKWSGLYEGETVVSSNAEFVTAFSVTYMDPADQILKDFEEILRTAKKI